ncbi:hypothetical protein [Rhizobium leguminosarum]|uniref:hypothetical protein n=1 Tax=Rhizobium leguminosarum TaxID=384 RepID=UPI002E14E387|nr:hypothetical protein U8Q02_41840 [Rhizobium leguminosarum]
MPYEVFLSNRGNPDRYQDSDHPLPGTESDYWVSCATIEEAQHVACEYRDDNHLGSGNMGLGSDVRDAETQEIVGRVSYNGRFRPEDGSDLEEAPPPGM